MATVEDKFEEFRGRYVDVAVHLLSHMGDPKKMMYAGDYIFVSSREESLYGEIVFRGLRGYQITVSREMDGTFIIYNLNPPSDIPKILSMDREQSGRTERFWERRELVNNSDIPF